MIEETKLGNLRTQSYSLIKTHKHIPEIKKFGLQNDVPISFTPTLSSNDFRGILTQVSFFVDEDIVPSDILNQAYQGKNWIEIVKKLPNNIDVSSWAHSHMVKLFSKKEGKIVTIYASYDNLLKWAAGSVVQILNIKNGFDEHLGLPLM